MNIKFIFRTQDPDGFISVAGVSWPQADLFHLLAQSVPNRELCL